MQFQINFISSSLIQINETNNDEGFSKFAFQNLFRAALGLFGVSEKKTFVKSCESSASGPCCLSVPRLIMRCVECGC